MQIHTAIADIIEKLQKADIVIHNACLCTFTKEADTDFSTYERVFDMNYYGALRCSGVGVTGFIGISPYASTKGALEALAKCLNLEYASDGISFHIIHPPLTRTKSAEPLPVPKEFMSDPQKVGYGIANHISSRHFILCHNFLQKIQTLICYLFPIKMGRLMSKMALRYIGNKQ